MCMDNPGFLEGAIKSLIALSKSLEDATSMADLFRDMAISQTSPRLRHLALHHRKERVRKKNMKRILRGDV